MYLCITQSKWYTFKLLKDGRKQLRRDEVFDNIRWLEVPLNVSPGRHTLKLIMIDPEVVVEQIVVNPDNKRYSYFGAGHHSSSGWKAVAN